ncbi:MAG: translation initiation factor IF-2 [Bradymonadaceae bacterium]
MPKRRVYEIADELGFSKQELVTKINSLGLGFSVGNYMTVLSPTEVDSLKRALKTEDKPKAAPKAPKKRAKADGKAEPVETAAAPTIRRRKKVEPAPTEVEVEVVEPVRRRRKVTDEEPEVEAAPAVAEEEVEEAPAEVEEVQEEPEEAPAVAEEPPAEEEPVAAEAEEVPEAVEATPEAEEAPEAAQVSEEVAAGAGEAAEAGEAAPVSPADEAVPGGRPAPRPEKKKGGAKVLGSINQSVLMERLAAEGKDFSPGPAKRAESSGSASQRTRKRGTKRVVEGHDLYDPKARRGKKRGSRGGSRASKRQRPQKTEITQAAEHKRVIRIEDVITVGDLAHQMGTKAAQVAMHLIQSGMMATVNTTLDFETAEIVAEEFGYTVENVAFDIGSFYDTAPDAEETLKPRAPVVTVMGHVDHGKTSLLDVIREASVTTGEAGGITQHIGAYMVQTASGRVTFLDTPGHEAFTALRARGAKATDIVVLVVAADDGVMPQTVEAINHARDAGVPILVAINKIDKPSANPDRVKTALSEYELIPEEWGGTTLFAEVSALEKINIDGLLETLALQTELEELRANPDRDAQGIVIEAELDIGRGPVATVLVQRGTLKQGEIIVSGRYYGRVRTMTDDRGMQIINALPSTPVEITGLSGIPEAGEPFFVVDDERNAKRITENVATQRRKESMASRAKALGSSLEDLSALIREGELKELKVILKGDAQGSVEAVKEAFGKLGNEEARVKIIHTGVGGITENDVNLAASSEAGAVVLGFNVRPDNRALEVAEKYGVQVVTHTVIYDAIEQIHNILEGLLSPIVEERVLGHAEVRDTFHAPKVGTIAGCYVQDGLVRRNARARLLRDGRVVYESTINSLRRFKDNVTEVKSGFECGTSLENYNDIKVGDIIEIYEFHEVTATF